ncbi:hypothetical protein ACH5RR_002270 [Cinchona calisaya]|uniref:Homing endonuclease LAGLIDADG domain-containing protein n=1 Tax=Cinchona calisaya TaxID=153742 RepID=A0ABD3B5U1_9GENT
MLLSIPISSSAQLPLHNSYSFLNQSPNFRTSLSLLRRRSLLFKSRRFSLFPRLFSSSITAAISLSAGSNLVEQLDSSPSSESRADDDSPEFPTERFDFDSSLESTELRRFDSPTVAVKELDELPEQWRRAKLAWLCKELPAHNQGTLIRMLNAQRKWMRQHDAVYVVVHCVRIRENETAFRVYKWMMQQYWFQFDFALATKLADYMGKERKYLKCREIFDDILNQGRVPSESTFHILIVAYLSSSAEGCLEEACNIFTRMIQLGGYKPRLSLHNSLFRAFVSKPGNSSKHYLTQAEFIFHNLTTSGLEIHKHIYGSLIWLHSYQDVVDMERISSLRAEMQSKGFEESREVLISVLRACSKYGDLEEAEKTWNKLFSFDKNPPSQAFVYGMELYAKVGEPMKSLGLFRTMQELLGSTSVMAYHKIVEVLSKAQNQELAESLMVEFINSGLKPLTPSFINLMDMYSNLGVHDKLESAFLQSLEKCLPNRTMYNIYLDSLVQVGSLERAEEIFSQMHGDATIGVNARSCNTILKGYLSCGAYVKAEKMHGFMRHKNYDIEPSLKEKLDYVLSLTRNVVKTPPKLKLNEDQREILVGMLLGGLRIVSSQENRKFAMCFEFKENSGIHSVLRKHIHDEFHEWLECRDSVDGSDDVPCHFTTIPHSCFSFYAEQFWPNSRPAIPKLIHRWLSPRILAYWYMYGGYRTSRGDILLKLKGSRESLVKILKALKTKSLENRVKRKGSVFWIGFQGGNAFRFWNLVEPFILDDLKVILQAGAVSPYEMAETRAINFDSGSDYDENASD